MEESRLDFACQATVDLQEALNAASDDKKENLILEHIKKLSADMSSSALDFNEKAEWVTGLKDVSLASYCIGRVALLDFFTYCCINCQHILPDLKDLEDLYTVDDGFVVVGVHSAKFAAERIPENVLNAAQRLGLRHPVLNDPKAELWGRLGISCWPTLVLLDPLGKPILVLAGEGHRDILFGVISVALNYYKDLKKDPTKGQIITLPPQIKSMLKFPGKITLNPFSSGRGEIGEPWLTISDSGNNRIVLADCFMTIKYFIGGPEAGLKDGSFQEARFDNPQGVCWLDANTLVVCDTGNHSLRKVRLITKSVELLAGTGVQTEYGDQGGLKFCQQSLASPWDVVLYRTPDMDMSVRTPIFGTPTKMNIKVEPAESSPPTPEIVNPLLRKVLIIAAAGSHQIWALFLDTTVWWKYKTFTEGTLIAIVGSGKEENRNNRYPNAAALAQPSGLALNGDNLFIADSESSSIRRLDLTSGQLSALAGGDRNPSNLFAFGDIDGNGYVARLQHPLGVTCCSTSKQIYVADTYNHKIKLIDVSSTECCSIYPFPESKETLSEPGGLCVTSTDQILYVADTNNHRILSINLETKLTKIIQLKVTEEEKNKKNTEEYSKDNLFKCPKTLDINSQEGSKIVLIFDCDTEKGDKGLHLTPNAPQRWTVKFLSSDFKQDLTYEWDIAGGIRAGNYFPTKFEARLKVSLEDSKGTMRIVRVEYFVSLCEGGLCFVRRFAVDCEVNLKVINQKVEKYILNCKLRPNKDIEVTLNE